MRVLISGGFGFVGGRLAQHLHQAGHQVVLGSRTVSPSPEWFRDAEVVKMDWSDRDALTAVCASVDVIIHAAGMNAQDSVANPAEALAFNGVATAHLLDAGCKNGVKRFLYLSTAHVYGSPLEGTITEETCARNLNPYATSHLAGESAVLYATQRKQIEGIVLRLSNAFGAPAHAEANCWMLLVNDLCRQAVNLRSMTLRSTGLQRRDFITLQDLSRVIAHMIDLPNNQIGDGLFNVGSGKSSRIIDMVELIQTRCTEVLGYTPEIIRPQPAKNEQSSNLDYRIDKLLITGFSLSDNVVFEIDKTLRMRHDLRYGFKLI
jgi:UDP-glucose 4-epimerase